MACIDNGKEPMVSVVISAYKRPAYLNQALHSVYEQTFTDYEVIVVDDGSGDEYTRQYDLGRNTRLIVHDAAQRGCAATKNTGIKASRGRYVAFLDDDDLWLPGKLESQVRAMEEHPEVGLAFCHYTLVDQDLHPLNYQRSPKKLPVDLFKRLLGGNIIKSPSAVMLRRDAIADVGGFNETLCGAEDWEMWIRVAYKYGFWSDDMPLILYRTHPKQMTGKFLTCRRADMQVMETIMKWSRRRALKSSGLVKSALCYRIQRLSKWECKHQGFFVALSLLFRAIRLRPFDVRNYSRLAESALIAFMRIIQDKRKA
ncbi:MAG: glycosyltransferase family A protein [Armatimonadota bacterium]